MSSEERDKMLEDLVKGSIGELNDNLIHEKVRLENHIDREKTKFMQQLSHRFNQETRQLKRCLKNMNYSDACTHYVTANWLNKELKDRGFLTSYSIPFLKGVQLLISWRKLLATKHKISYNVPIIKSYNIR